MDTEKNEMLFRLVKITDIGYITVIYFLPAFFFSIMIDRFIGPFDPYLQEKKPTYRILLECILHIFLIGVIIYIARNIVEKIPSPLNGVQGLKHLEVKELSTAPVFVFIFLFFQNNLVNRLKYLNTRF